MNFCRRLTSGSSDTEMTTHRLTARYQRDGFVFLQLIGPSMVRQVIQDADRVAALCADMHRSRGDFNLESPGGGYGGQHGDEEDPYVGCLRKVSNFVRYSPAARTVAADRCTTRVVIMLIGKATLIHSVLWCKLPSIGAAKPPHQDAPYLSGQPDDFVTLWIALDNASRENGCLHMIGGSQAVGPVNHGAAEPQLFLNDTDRATATAVALAPGEAVAFHPWTIHWSDPNTSEFPRRALMLRYLRVYD